ncbi:endolytic transglycosylase MltG [Kitasatospora sp. NBC_01250]|uniref:endolytic transglycosylase MltG n=1 Tax=Kitasatospora sp. NBC_01250 TaxID=2903571 RepID=UPI002E2F8C23|nr:endolytic transglycosylase MltG [Kitasatospora sp. NBC_01250]
MTDLGRGYGSQPWHATEPGYGEQPAQAATAGESEYLPQDPYGQQNHQYQVQGQEQYGQQQAYVPQDPYSQQQWQQQAFQQQYPQQQGYPQQGGYVQQTGYPQQAEYQQQGHPQQDGGYQQVPQQYVSQQFDTGQFATGPFDTGQFPQQQQFAGQQQGFQQQPPQQQAVPQQVAQPQPQPQAQPQPQRTAPQQAPRPAGPGPDGIDWEAEAAALEAGAHPGAAARQAAEGEESAEGEGTEGEYADDEYEEYPEDGEHTEDDFAEEGHEGFLGPQDLSQEAEAERKAKGKKSGRRNGGACLLVALVLLGGLGGAGWWGYGFYQSTFGPPPDFTGAGTGKVQIQIQDGASAGDMGQVLQKAGVVKSVGAFNNAYTKANKTIQPGYYSMQLQMSGDAAVALMVSEAGGDSLIVPEGKKSSDIYAMIDTKLKLSPGTTANAAKANAANLGLPAYANNNPEGFLWPTKYSVAQGMKPEDLLKQMVSNALAEYSQLNLDTAAQSVGLKNAYDVVNEASILQAEGNNVADFGKMARVISNRLASNDMHHALGMDTTLQYALGTKTLTYAQIHDGSNKYNSYINPGLPPTPISNPGEDAIKAVLNPTPGDWTYFLAMTPTNTVFYNNRGDFSAGVKQYCTAHGQAFDASDTTCK